MNRAKGSNYERGICKRLSLWVSDFAHKDCFWRSAMSGGRSTVSHKNTGKRLNSCAGDITCTSEEGRALTGLFVVECKFYRDLQLQGFFFGDQGKVMGWWNKLLDECEGVKRPLLFIKQNNRKELAFTDYHGHRILRTGGKIEPHLIIPHIRGSLLCFFTPDILSLRFAGIKSVYEQRLLSK